MVIHVNSDGDDVDVDNGDDVDDDHSVSDVMIDCDVDKVSDDGCVGSGSDSDGYGEGGSLLMMMMVSERVFLLSVPAESAVPGTAQTPHHL